MNWGSQLSESFSPFSKDNTAYVEILGSFKSHPFDQSSKPLAIVAKGFGFCFVPEGVLVMDLKYFTLPFLPVRISLMNLFSHLPNYIYQR